jgi:hypothetical protein
MTNANFVPNVVSTPSAEAPKPMPFAVMRNSHEALRASILLQEQALAAGDTAAFAAEWKTYQRALAVHMTMEEECMFPLLDAVGDGAIKSGGLSHEHVEDARVSAAVNDALAADRIADLRSAWAAWQAEHLHHLKHEEEIMMPLTMKTAATPEARARVVHERLITPGESRPDFDWYIAWVVFMLSRHGSVGQPASVATRVFAWGLQHACSPTQWTRLLPIVESQCVPAVWSEIAAKFSLTDAGKVTSSP